MILLWSTFFSVIFATNAVQIDIPLTFSDSLEYYGEIAIGKPPQKLRVVFDSQLHDSWVFGNKLTTTEEVVIYNPSKSKYYKAAADRFMKGLDRIYRFDSFAYDNIYIGEMKLRNQQFAILTEHSSDEFKNALYGGVIGLGYTKYPVTYNSRSIFNSMHLAVGDFNGIFSIYINRQRNSINGKIIFGGSEPTVNRAKLVTMDIKESDGAWKLNLDGIKLGKRHVNCTDSGEIKLSTSTVYLNGPKDDVQSLNSAINARRSSSYLYVVNCKTVSTLPNLVLNIDRKIFILTPNEYIIKRNIDSKDVCVSGIAHSHSDYSTNKDHWTIGMIFMSKYYTEFNFEKHTVGVVPMK